MSDIIFLNYEKYNDEITESKYEIPTTNFCYVILICSSQFDHDDIYVDMYHNVEDS